ncbi:MAG: hypothetical protein ACI4F3_08195 [Enterocloster sp.]
MISIEENIARVLVETTVQKALKEMKNFPERGIRNLIDMGVEFSGGKFQKYFLRVAQDMLQNENSAYYQLIREMIQYADLEKVKRFGVNLGYNSCTIGAKKIRTAEALDHFNIPWSLGFHIRSQISLSQEKRYQIIIEQGMKLGIYTYFFYIDGNSLAVLPLLKVYSQCAFVFFCRPTDITSQFLDETQQIQNLMIAVEDSKGAAQACGKLKRNGYLYAVYFLYRKEDFRDILNGTILTRIEKTTPPVTAIMPHPSCPPEVQESVYQYVLEVRERQHHPTILLDVKYDIMYVDRVISNHSFMVWFDADGQLHSGDRIYTSVGYNIFQNGLPSILKLAFSKDSEKIERDMEHENGSH